MTLNHLSRLTLAAAVTMLGCGSGDGESVTTDTRAGTAGNSQSPVKSAVRGSMSDANIFYLLDVANMGDSAKGALATTKGTSAEVRGFARMMVRDHHTMRAQVQNLSKRLAFQPAPPAGDSLRRKLDNALSKLNAAAKGRDFDKAYIDHEVAAHRELLTIAVSAMSITQNSEIKNLIQNAAPMIQAHMDKAQAIQKNLQN